MLKSVTVKPDTITSEILFFDSVNFDELPDPRIVPLFGANGSGKTTLLTQIEYALLEYIHRDELKEEEDNFGKMLQAMKRERFGIRKEPEIRLAVDNRKTMFYRYRNSQDNFRERAGGFSPDLLNARWEASALSEGQSIVYSAEDLLKGMLRSTKTRESFVENDTDCILLLDEIDSGMSLDNIEKLMRIIKRVLAQKRNIQFLMSFNNPYVVHFFPYVISMYDGKVHEMHTFDDMLSELKANQKMLDKARKNSRGKFRIFE